MGYIELIKITDQGRIAVTFEDDKKTVEKAEYCDICYRYRPESKMMTVFLADDDWIRECDECRVKDKNDRR